MIDIEQVNRIIQYPVYSIAANLRTYDMVSSQKIPIIIGPKDEEIINTIELSDNRFINLIKSRQIGGTTLMAALAAYKLFKSTHTNHVENIFYLSNNMDGCINFINKVFDFLSCYQTFLWPTNSIINSDWRGRRKEIFLPNGSRLKAMSMAPDTFIGQQNPTWVVLDEPAYMEDTKKAMSSLYPAFTTETRVTSLSTPNGKDDYFYGVVKGGFEGTNQYVNIYYKWYHNSKYNKDLVWIKNGDIIEQGLSTTEELLLKGYQPTSEWYRQMCKNINQKNNFIQQELGAEFIDMNGEVIVF